MPQWSITTTDEFDDWFGSLDESTKEEVRYVVGLLARAGPLLGRPYADTLKGSRYANMKELRVGGRKMAIRVAFAFDSRRNAVLLVAGDKRGGNEHLFYRCLISRADGLFLGHLRKTR